MDGSAPLAKKDFITSRGMKFPKTKPFITGQVRGALRTGRYEAKETEAVLKVVREGDTVIELGAGIGYMSTLLATKRNATVHAFEANPALIPYIHSVHEANGISSATVTNAILGARKGKASFFVRKNFIASSLSEIEGSEVIATEEIEVLNAKSVFADLKPTVLVCDIEGAEADLIPAMDLSGLRAAVIELHPQWIGPEGVNAVFSAMIAAGLAYYARASNAKVVAFRRTW